MVMVRRDLPPVNDDDRPLGDVFHPTNMGDLYFPSGLARELAVGVIGSLMRHGWRCSQYPLGFTDPYTADFYSVISDFVRSKLAANIGLWADQQKRQGLPGFAPFYRDREPRYEVDDDVIGVVRHALIGELRYLAWASGR